MKITAKDTADFYNNIFFDEEKNLVDPGISLLIKQGDHELIIPNIIVPAKTPFHQIILNFHNKLLREGPLDMDEELPEPVHVDPALIDFKRMQYRNKVYFVEQVDLETFRVLNEERDKEISLKSPVAKAILKRFREA